MLKLKISEFLLAHGNIFFRLTPKAKLDGSSGSDKKQSTALIFHGKKESW
jgi:hypothetical protein